MTVFSFTSTLVGTGLYPSRSKEGMQSAYPSRRRGLPYSSQPILPRRVLTLLVAARNVIRRDVARGFTNREGAFWSIMVPNGKSPLTPLAQDALDALGKRLPDEGEFTYEHAYAILKEEEGLERPAAEDIIERLYMKGHLYEVEGKLRFTDYGSE